MAFSLRQRYACPVELAMEVLGGKWKTVILAQLKQGPMRYAGLRARIPALSDKMLTQRLRDLEELGLIRRSGSGQRGTPRGYALSARGRSLRSLLGALYDWGQQIAPAVGATIEPRAGASVLAPNSTHHSVR